MARRDEQVADITRALQELQERQTTAQQERQDAVQDKAAAVAAAQEAERCAAAAQESLQKCKLTSTRNQEVRSTVHMCDGIVRLVTY